jgi:hypothetical protein
MRIVVIALATIAILTAPAYAQGRGKASKASNGGQQTEEQKKKATQAEKAYKDALGKIPEQKTSDPWANVR